MTLALSLIVQNNTFFCAPSDIFTTIHNMIKLKIENHWNKDNRKYKSLTIIHSYCHHTNPPQNSKATMCLQTWNRKRWKDFHTLFLQTLYFTLCACSPAYEQYCMSAALGRLLHCTNFFHIWTGCRDVAAAFWVVANKVSSSVRLQPLQWIVTMPKIFTSYR